MLRLCAWRKFVRSVHGYNLCDFLGTNEIRRVYYGVLGPAQNTMLLLFNTRRHFDRLRAVPVGRRMGSPVFQRSASARAVADVRGEVAAEASGPAGGRLDQVERAVQTRPAPSVRAPAGVRQAGGPARDGPALRAGRRRPAAVHHVVRGPVRVLAHVPVGRQLFRQRRGPAERHGRVHTRFRVPVQGDTAVRLPVAVAHQLRPVRTPDDGRGRRQRAHHRQTHVGQYAKPVLFSTGFFLFFFCPDHCA